MKRATPSRPFAPSVAAAQPRHSSPFAPSVAAAQPRHPFPFAPSVAAAQPRHPSPFAPSVAAAQPRRSRGAVLLLLTASLAFGAAPARAAEATRRFAVVAGADEGGPGRTPLRYATSDARDVSQVLRELGGVAPADVTLLEDPTPASLRAALARVSAEASAVRARGGRSELFLYYSGHSDEAGLLLGKERISYADLRAELDRTPAEVRVAILDSCASGAFTRQKGGVHRPPFLLDASNTLRGHAFLTSSAADEASQESDRLRASFFTHALLTGMRGAADANGDSRVTLNEAYQFAFQETLAQTESTQAGPQHATYDIGLVGSGDVVLTDLHLAGATLVVPEALEGRVFVRDASGALVAELRKVRGASVELALPPGGYQVRVARGERVEAGTFAVPGQGRVVVLPAALSPVALEATTMRGEAGIASDEPAPRRKVLLDVGLFPPVTVNDAAGRPVVNTFSLGLPVSRSEQLDGVAVGALAHLGERVTGVQVGGLATTANDSLAGVQVAGLYTGSGPMQGVQVAGLAAWAGGDATFAQVAGLAALARGRMQGVQVSGIANWAGALEGVQVGTVNVTGPASGIQVGVVNVGTKVNGVQVGVVNVADDVDVPIGLVNVVKEGRQELEVFATEISVANVVVRLGSQRFQTLLTGGIAAQKQDGETRWTGGAGFGVMLLRNAKLTLDLDALAQSVYYGPYVEGGSNVLVATLRPTVAWRLAPRLSLLGAVSANVLVSGNGPHTDIGRAGWNVGTGKNDVRIFPGFVVGVRL